MTLIDLDTTIKVQNIHCYDEADGPGDAEPYLWTLIFKIDGETIRVGPDGRLTGTPLVNTTPGSHGNLNNTDVGSDEDVPVPAAIGEYRTILRPIPVDPSLAPIIGSSVPGFIGALTVLMEEDNVTDDGAEAGHAALNSAFTSALHQFVTERSITQGPPAASEINNLKDEVRNAIRPAIKDALSIFQKIWAAVNPDDEIGDAVYVWSSVDFSKTVTSIPFSSRWQNEGDWELDGAIWATPSNLGWHGWYGLGGAITDAPSVVVVHPGFHDIYVCGTDGRLWQKWWDGSRWNPSDEGWVPHDDGFLMGSAPCVIAEGDRFRDVYARGRDGKVYHKYWDGQGWHGWYGLGGEIVGAPSVVVVHPGFHDIYVCGTDGRLWQKWWDGSRWNPSDEGWVPHDDDGFLLGGAPCAIAEGDRFRDVYVRGRSGNVVHKYWVG